MNLLCRFLILGSFLAPFSLLSQQDVASGPGYERLPDVLLGFDAVLHDQKVELTWSADHEQGKTCFTIERSKDGIAFETVLVIRNLGSNSNAISYFEVDSKPFEGISYYRLTQTSAAGHILASRVVSVNTKASSTLQCLSRTPANANAKETLLVLRNEKGEESFSKLLVENQDEPQISPGQETMPKSGTYVIIGSSDNRLYSKTLKVQ